MVWINSYKRVNPGSPFGGVGQSGYGREMGFDAMREYTQVKSVWVNVDAQIPPYYRALKHDACATSSTPASRSASSSAPARSQHLAREIERARRAARAGAVARPSSARSAERVAEHARARGGRHLRPAP